jgi:hypothetical protein
MANPASGWTLVKAPPNRAVWRSRMAKASNNSQHISTFRPKPLSLKQRSAIDLLIVGKSDGEVAEALDLDRSTVWGWRTQHLVLQSELEQARGALWRAAAERLRGLMAKTLDNIGGAIEKGDVKASFALLKAVGIYGAPEVNHIRDWRLESLIQQEAERRVTAEGIPMDATHEALIRLTENTCYRQRREEIAAELRREYGEAESL